MKNFYSNRDLRWYGCPLQALSPCKRGSDLHEQFAADPSLTGDAILTGTAKWFESGEWMVPIHQYTDAVGSQQGVMVFPDFTEQAVIGGLC